MTTPASSAQIPSFRFPVTPGVIWSLAVQTLRQCIRRWVLLVLVLFFLVVLIGTGLMPTHDAAKRLEMLINLCMMSMSFLGIIVAVFLAATVLPEDRTESTIVTVMTKPVGHLNYLLGRVAGLALTLGIILAVMGAVSWVFIRVAGMRAERETGRADLLTGKRGIAADDIYWVQHLPDGKTNTNRLAPDADSCFLRGPAEDYLVFFFRKGLENLPKDDNEITLEMKPYIATGGALPDTEAELLITSAAKLEKGEKPPEPFRKSFAGAEKLTSERGVKVVFPRKFIDPVEGVKMRLRRTSGGAYVRFSREDFQLMTPSVPFEYSYFKSLVIVFFGLLLVVLIAIAASTFLNAWVAVVTAFAGYFFSEAREVLSDLMMTLQSDTAGFLGLQMMQGHSHGSAPAPAPDPFYVVAVNKLVYGMLWLITHIFPDYDRFESSHFLTAARDVPAAAVWSAAAVLLTYGACYLALGHIIFWRREMVP